MDKLKSEGQNGEHCLKMNFVASKVDLGSMKSCYDDNVGWDIAKMSVLS